VAKTRVAIFGGGCGGVAAAFWLTAPELQDRFEVTLYSHGWRLGGKGASGRAGPEARIEEHGIHFWLGSYDHAFRMMRLAYAEQPAPKPFSSLSDAFIPIDTVTLMANDGDGPAPAWCPWTIPLPVQAGVFPGDRARLTLLDLVAGLSDFIAWLFHVHGSSIHVPGASEALDHLNKAIVANSSVLADIAAGLLGALNSALTVVMGALVEAEAQTSQQSSGRRDVMRALTLINLGLSLFTGLLHDVIGRDPDFEKALSALDTEEFREWLARHGAWPETLAGAPLRSLYDLTFAYPLGDTTKPGAMAAGVSVGLVLTMASYAGAPMFKMVSAMGDTIFAPLYRVLQARGVKVNFFNRLVDVVPSADGTIIDSVKVWQQADFVNGAYDPLFKVKDEDCWPAEPFWEQLKNGEALKLAQVHFEDSRDPTHVSEFPLKHGVDFDELVLALPPETLRYCTKLLTQPRWREMIDNSASVRTQAYQIWLDTPSSGLGWTATNPVAAYAEPYATWADMSHVLSHENWPAGAAAQSVHYFCGPLPGPTPGEPVTGWGGVLANQNMMNWIGNAMPLLWPDVPMSPPKPGTVLASYPRDNIDGSELYVQVPPGNTAHRLHPGDRVYANLTQAGDWTRVRFSGGCVENAVESGLLVARTLSGMDKLGEPGA
jgi:uncharacterized protein with NAD-binding domain and iron-sulfur cluster